MSSVVTSLFSLCSLLLAMAALAADLNDAPLPEPDYAALAAQCWEEQAFGQDEYSTADIARFETLQQEVVDKLAESELVEDQIARALLARLLDERAANAAVDRALELAPDDPLVLQLAVGHCREFPGQDWCTPELNRRWLQSDPRNILPYLIQVESQLESDDINAVQATLVTAAEMVEGSTPWGIYTAMVGNAMAAYGSSPSVTTDELAMMGFGAEMASMPTPFQSLFDACGMSIDPPVVNACLQIARAMMADGDSMMDQSLGSALVRQMARETPGAVTPEELSEAEQLTRKNTRIQQRFSYLQCRHGLSNAAYLRELLKHGELRAMQRISDTLENGTAEAAALLRDSNKPEPDGHRMETIGMQVQPATSDRAALRPDNEPTPPAHSAASRHFGLFAAALALVIALVVLIMKRRRSGSTHL